MNCWMTSISMTSKQLSGRRTRKRQCNLQPRDHLATDPMGVLADYAEAKERTRLRRQANAEAHRLQMKDKAITVKPSNSRADEDEEKDDSDDDKKPKEVSAKPHCFRYDLDPDDPEFIRLYRERRMQELLASQRKTFGFFKSITASQFSDEIDREVESGAFVVIHLHQKYLAMSVRMNYVLQKLAQKFLYVKFLRIIATDADAQYDDYALPTLLIYKNGDLVTSLIRVTDELPDNWDQDDVEVLMAKYGVLHSKIVATSNRSDAASSD
ncbi:phosducin, putative [Acanthamoeba castellanii str. Neff]|uniref:Phosducin, putative n=1 Tax=Acanthamoeba castellanii (strain ATCC 30010 / Neff) TaxID=1257118 RepID=L8GWB8_ACACF|nr:phosducin, putative [Acanthamoeba castellanii str. Neff]ELR17514.1 phosducin, putative [Acanthamoeba castellanii str. Neff]